MSRIAIHCPKCLRKYDVTPDFIGKLVVCSANGCGLRFEAAMPDPSDVEEPIRREPNRQSSSVLARPIDPQAVRLVDHSFDATKKQLVIISTLLSIMLLLQLISTLWMSRTPPALLPQWEYRVVAPSDGMFDTEMNRLGKEGWEVISARRATAAGDSNLVSYEVILKRHAK